MAFSKITTTELASRGATTLPNQPTISATALKQEFDAPAKEIVAPKFNNLIDELEAGTAAASLGMTPPTGRTGSTIQAVMEEVSDAAASSTEAQHTHNNKAVIDKFSESEDRIYYDNDELVISDDLNSYYTKSVIDSALDGKVDKNGTDSLMTADEHTKLSGIAAGAEVNVQSDFNQSDNTADDFIKNKPTLGTAAALDVPASGNASSSQVVKGNDSRLSDDRNAADVYSWAKQSTKPSYTASEVGAIASTEKGANGGVAELDSNGKVPSAQLPSYVDDVEEYASLSDFPATGETGKIYIAKDTNKQYRWSGTAYVEISESLALGETSSTAYAGNKGKANADAISAIKDGATIDSFGDVETALGDYIQKSSTAGLVKNDGTIDTTSYVSDISGKADKVSSATSGNFAGLDSNGNLTDSGSKASDFLTQHQDISGKQDKTLSAQVEGQSTVEGALGALSNADRATRQLIENSVGWESINLADIPSADQTFTLVKSSARTKNIYPATPITLKKSILSIKLSDVANVTKDVVIQVLSSGTAVYNTTFTAENGVVDIQIDIGNAASFDRIYFALQNSDNDNATITVSDIMITDPIYAGFPYQPYHASVEEYCASKEDVKDIVGWGNKNQLPNNAKSQQGSGVTYTVNSNGTYSVVGTASAITQLSNVFVAVKNYNNAILTGIPQKNLNIYMTLTDTTTSTDVATDIGEGSSAFNLVEGHRYNCKLIAGANFNAQTPIIVSPMISRDGGAYEPYHASVDSCKADNSVIAPVEDGTTIQNPSGYAVGSHAIRNGAFITWKNAKAQSETINDASDYDSEDVASLLTPIDGLSGIEIAQGIGTTTMPSDCYLKKIGNVVYANLKLNNITVSNYADILTIPEGFRPLKDIYIAIKKSGVDNLYLGQIYTTGKMQSLVAFNNNNLTVITTSWLVS